MLDPAMTVGTLFLILLLLPCIAGLFLLLGFRLGSGQFRLATKVSFAIFIVTCMVLFSGCSALRVLNPFDNVHAADAEWDGVKSGEVISLTATLASAVSGEGRTSVLASILAALGASDPLGVLLPVSIVGDPIPRYILCTEAYYQKCKGIPINAKIHFAGRPLGSGSLWSPSRLTAENFND